LLLQVQHTPLPNSRELPNAPLEQFEQLPHSAEDLEAIHIIVDEDYAKFIYDPIVHQK
jgi:hypothetical protein